MRLRKPPSRGMSRMLPASEWIAHFVRLSGKSVSASTSITPQAWSQIAADVLRADRLAHAAARAVGADDVLGAHGALLAGAFAGGAAQRHRDRVLALVELEPEELEAVVRHHARGALRHELGEVVEHARLVDDAGAGTR